MPVYDARLNDRGEQPLRLPSEVIPMPAEPFPRFDGRAGRLFDANGELIEYVLRCDTETGEVVRYDRRDGKFWLNTETKCLVVLTERRPAPLSYLSPDDVAELREGAATMRRLWFRKNPGQLPPDSSSPPDTPFIVVG